MLSDGHGAWGAAKRSTIVYALKIQPGGHFRYGLSATTQMALAGLFWRRQITASDGVSCRQTGVRQGRFSGPSSGRLVAYTVEGGLPGVLNKAVYRVLCIAAYRPSWEWVAGGCKHPRRGEKWGYPRFVDTKR
jgi:hypothetical protein